MVGANSWIAVYIMASRRNGTLYVGVTSDIAQRAFQHRTGAIEGFTRRYGNSISARIGVVARDGLDACVYRDVVPPKDKTPPATRLRSGSRARNSRARSLFRH